jgi:hypothetical protein
VKRFVLCSLVVLVLAALAGPVVAACMRTGIQTDASSSVDTVFFFDKGRRFDASSLRIWLSTSASGNATIRRGVKISADSIYFFEDAQTIRPGGVFESNDDGVYCFAFAKTSSDVLSWSGSQCADGSGINAAGETLAELLNSAPAVETETFTVVTNLSTAVRADTLRFSFDASDFREVMFKFLADSLTSDSVTVHFCSSTTGSWTAGNVAIFDRDPTTAALQGWTLSHGAAGAAIPVYGMAVSPTNINGAHIVGPYINGYIVLRNTAGVQCMTRRIKNLSVFAACKR